MSVLLFPAEAGTRGLRGEVLHHLVESRYAAALASNPACAILHVDQLHDLLGHSVAPTPEHTTEALEALASVGLVERMPDGARWRATPAGVVSVDRTHETDGSSVFATESQLPVAA